MIKFTSGHQDKSKSGFKTAFQLGIDINILSNKNVHLVWSY